ncbi:MAG: DUF2157 domain-containing protein [Aequorivita sp.]
MSINKDLPELLKAGIISPETAEQIQEYYKSKGGSSSNRLFVAFGILGSILVGLGIILIIAHNWDELSRATKTIFAFLPLVIGQIICGFVLLKKSNNTTWRESATVFLFFGMCACIALVGQIYHIPGNLSSFLLMWMLLCLPLVYIMKSSTAALLYLIGITYYAVETSYFSHPMSQSYIYWGLLLAVFPHCYFLFRNHPKSNFLRVENWLIPISITIVLGTLADAVSELMFVAYFSLFGLFYLIGNNSFFKEQNLKNNPYKVIGTLGTLFLLFTMSFDGFWSELRGEEYKLSELITVSEFWVATGITLLALGYLFFQQKNKPLHQLPLLSPIFLLFILIFIIGFYSSIAVILINIIILVIGILTLVEGGKEEHFGILNFGLSIITLWIIIRFLNSDLSFVVRGLLLMAIGIGFFTTNYLMFKKRRQNE